MTRPSWLRVVRGGASRDEAPGFVPAFRAAFEAHAASVYRYVQRLSGDPELAADLTQEAFMRLLERGTMPDDVRGWLATVAANLWRDGRRQGVRRAALLARDPDAVAPRPIAPSPDAALLAAERTVTVRQALDGLPLRDRQLLLLRHEGYSYRELAAAVGVAEGSVGTLLLRATAAFRRAYTAIAEPHVSHAASD